MRKLTYTIATETGRFEVSTLAKAKANAELVNGTYAATLSPYTHGRKLHLLTPAELTARHRRPLAYLP